MILPLALILCLTVSSQVKEIETSSEDLEKELRATLEQFLKAWSSGDIDTITEIRGDAIGYGYRNPFPRLFNKEFMKAANERFLDSMEIFEVTLTCPPQIDPAFEL